MSQTPTQAIYNAWRKTQRPIIYVTNDGAGKEKLVECDFADPTENEGYNLDIEGECTICGGIVSGGVYAKNQLGTSYTDWGRHKKQESSYVCESCLFCIGMNAKAGRMTLARYSFFASEQGLEILNRKQMRDRLLDPPTPPFVAVCTISQKKHLSTKAKMAYSRERYPCMLEEECIDVDASILKDQILTIEALRTLGAIKEEILKGNLRFDFYRAWGPGNYDNATKRINVLKKNPRMFELALFVSQKSEDQEAAKCYLGFIPTT